MKKGTTHAKAVAGERDENEEMEEALMGGAAHRPPRPFSRSLLFHLFISLVLFGAAFRGPSARCDGDGGDTKRRRSLRFSRRSSASSLRLGSARPIPRSAVFMQIVSSVRSRDEDRKQNSVQLGTTRYNSAKPNKGVERRGRRRTNGDRVR